MGSGEEDARRTTYLHRDVRALRREGNQSDPQWLVGAELFPSHVRKSLLVHDLNGVFLVREALKANPIQARLDLPRHDERLRPVNAGPVRTLPVRRLHVAERDENPGPCVD